MSDISAVSKNNLGFTLIELMIVVAIIAILAAIALPAYQNYTIRTKISEAVVACDAAKAIMSEAFMTDGVSGLTSASIAINAIPVAEKRSKYVQGYTAVAAAPWNLSCIISGTGLNGIPGSLDGTIIMMTPNVQQIEPTPNSIGAIDWACASETRIAATLRALGSVVDGTLPARYAPSECR